MKRVALVVASMALVLSGVAVAVTSNAYTDASGAYNGCVGEGSGLLRVLEPGGVLYLDAGGREAVPWFAAFVGLVAG